MLGIKWIDKVNNDIVYRTVGRDKLTLQVQQRQLRFVGHSLRRNENDPINKYVFWASEERHFNLYTLSKKVQCGADRSADDLDPQPECKNVLA